MLIDILIFCPVLTCTLLGWRDGIVRKLVASVVIIISLFLGQIYMHDVGMLWVNKMHVDPSDAATYGFLTILFGALIIQSLIYKFAAGSYKIGGIADHMGGTVIGFFEGILFTSCILFIFALSGIPSRRTVHDSQFYKPVVNVAPQILDVASTLGPEAIEKLKDFGTSSDTTAPAPSRRRK